MDNNLSSDLFKVFSNYFFGERDIRDYSKLKKESWGFVTEIRDMHNEIRLEIQENRS